MGSGSSLRKTALEALKERGGGRRRIVGLMPSPGVRPAMAGKKGDCVRFRANTGFKRTRRRSSAGERAKKLRKGNFAGERNRPCADVVFATRRRASGKFNALDADSDDMARRGVSFGTSAGKCVGSCRRPSSHAGRLQAHTPPWPACRATRRAQFGHVKVEDRFEVRRIAAGDLNDGTRTDAAVDPQVDASVQQHARRTVRGRVSSKLENPFSRAIF